MSKKIVLEEKEMKLNNRRIRIAFHSFGYASLGGAVLLQIIVFSDIFQFGYFMATERNQVILYLEIILTVFALIYFSYIYQRFIRSV